MERTRLTFTVALANVPIRISCRHEENKAFLRDYLTDKEPVFTIEPTEDDLARIQQGLDRIAEAERNPKEQRSDSFLENNAIHALIAEKLVEYDILLFHGSALCMDGQAYIFTAPSGTGKSTHARLWWEAFGDRVWMINDDKPLIRVQDGKAIACADEFLPELENGLDTLLGERGAGLSEGQMQRLAIARAIFADSPILLLDEATSALDEETEKHLLHNLRSLTDKTVVIVTHRKAVLSICDRVQAFNESGVAEA